MDVDPSLDQQSPALVPEQPHTKEESLLQSAAAGIDEVDDQPNRVVLPPTPVKKSHKKLVLFVLILLILAGAGSYFFLVKKPKTTTSTSSNSSTTTEPTKTVATKTYEADKISYLYKGTMADPYSVYYRPAAGGDRKEVTKLDRDETVLGGDAKGQTAIFYTSTNKLYVSQDGGLTYTMAYKTDATQDITSAKVSGEGDRIVIGTAALESTATNGAYSLSLAGKDKKELITKSQNAVFVDGFNAAKNKLVYETGCWRCDGGRAGYFIYDTSTKKDQSLVATTDAKSVTKMNVSADMSQAVYVLGVLKAPSDAALASLYAPYKVTTVNLSSLKASVIDTIGTSGEKNANGTAKSRDFLTGFVAGTNTPYYVEGASVYKITGTDSKLAYTAEKAISGVYYLNDKNIVVAVDANNSIQDAGDFALSNYDFATKKSTLIFQGDNYTYVVGVTTK